MPPPTLLRYPGGKTRAIDILAAHLPEGVTEMASPFLGGGSFEVACAKRGIRVHAYDAFDLLINFWQCVAADPVGVARVAEEEYPMIKQRFLQIRDSMTSDDDAWRALTDVQRAAYFFCVNRCCFGGLMLSHSGFVQRGSSFTLNSIRRVREFDPLGISFGCCDFEESIARHPDVFLYCDPPYCLKDQTLYGRRGDMHESFDHDRLKACLDAHPSWMLSYNDCAYIRELYAEYRIQEVQWNYSMRGGIGAKGELLIFSK